MNLVFISIRIPINADFALTVTLDIWELILI